MRLGAYVPAIWNGTQIGLNLYNVDKNKFTHSIKYSNLWERDFQTKCNQKPLAQWVEVEDPWNSYVGFSFWACSGCNGLSSHLSTFRGTSEIERYLRSIDSLYYYYQSIFYFIITNIKFSKVLCNPKLRWHSRIKLYVNWHSFLFLKTSRDTLNLKLNVKWNLSNIHNDAYVI